MSIAVSLLPVILFLIVLNSLDTFKLLKPSLILTAMFWGTVSALLAYPVNTFFFSVLESNLVTGLTAPVTEESLKFIFIIALFHKNKLGFLADSLIIGFAIGAGFSLIENIFYLEQFSDQNIMLWIVRGFGTAIMHGTATAVTAVIAQYFMSKAGEGKPKHLLLGLLAGIVLHILFNNFFLPPMVQTVLQIILLPLIVLKIFTRSEKSLRNWMEEESDSELELLRMMKKGEFKSTRSGKYILSIKNNFPPEIIVDMLAYIRLHLELSIKAKGLLLMKETGFNPGKEEELKSMLAELEFLSNSIGKTGMRTLSPIINLNNKDLWKLNLLK